MMKLPCLRETPINKSTPLAIRSSGKASAWRREYDSTNGALRRQDAAGINFWRHGGGGRVLDEGYKDRYKRQFEH
jgi:hypothetical protein